MRRLKNLIFAGLVAGSLHGQSASVNGPFLGFTPDDSGTAIRPIIGIPGAAALTNRLDLGGSVRTIVISPKQDYALAARTEDAQVVMIDLRNGALAFIDGTRSGADLIAISPTGTTAAIYDRTSKTVQVIANLPQAPLIIHEHDAAAIAGRGAGIAVADDGGTVLFTAVGDDDRSTLWVMDASAASWLLSSDQPAAATFVPKTNDAIIAENATQSASLVLDLRHGAIRVPLLAAQEGVTSITAASASEDGKRVFFADAASGNVAVVDMETQQLTLLPCGCRVTSFSPLKGTSIYRLNESSREPTMVLDASTALPRIVVIPAVSELAVAEEQ